MSAQENITSKSAHVYLESLQGTIFDFFFLEDSFWLTNALN